MRGEVVLFLAAGVLASGLASLLAVPGGVQSFPLSAATAAVSLTVMVGLAVVGVHPLISIAASGTWLAHGEFDPNLLALTFLMAWAVGVAAGPLSGLHLTIRGRYGIDGRRLPAWNLRYTLLMLGLCALVLHAYEWLS